MTRPAPASSALLWRAADRARGRIVKEPGGQGHWIWQGPVNGNGYPIVGEAGQVLIVSRVMYASEYGDVPRRLKPLCSLRSCVKPDHRAGVPEAPREPVPPPVTRPPVEARGGPPEPEIVREIATPVAVVRRPFRPSPPRSAAERLAPTDGLPLARASRWDIRPT